MTTRPDISGDEERQTPFANSVSSSGPFGPVRVPARPAATPEEPTGQPNDNPAMWAGTGWGTVGVAVAALFGGIIVSIFFALAAALVTGVTFERMAKGDLGQWGIPASIVGQTLVWIAVPVLWSKRAALGGARRFLWLRFRAIDALWGFLLALVTKGLFGVAATYLWSAEDSSASSEMWKNILGAHGIGPKVLLFVGAALLTPFAEELLFRGLLFQGPRRFAKGTTGSVLAVVVSTLVFTLAHPQWLTTSLRGALLGLASVAGLALANALITLRTRRMGAAFWCHFFYNASGVLAAFLLF